MDLSHPLATLLPRAGAAALTVLAGTSAPLTGRRVAELAGAQSHASILRALNGLVGTGLVMVEPAGRANLYTLNRSHLLAPAVQDMIDSLNTVQADLIAALKAWPIQSLHASLYGSVARGEAGPSSDIDVLVVRPHDLDSDDVETWDGQLAEVEALILARTGNHLSWLETTIPDLSRAQRAREPIFDSWREDAIRLVGPSLDALLRTSSTRSRQDS